MNFPTRRAGGEEMDETGSLNVLRLLKFSEEILGIGNRVSGGIRNLVISHNRHDIFFGVLFGLHDRSGRRPSEKWRCGTSLSPCVHIAFIVIADVDEIFVSFCSTREGLDPDIKSPTISSPHSHQGFPIAFNI